MRNFNDTKGDTWGIRVTRTSLRKVQRDTGVLLTDLFQDEMEILNKVCRDPVFAGDIIWSLCSEQAAERSISLEDFEGITDGEAFEPAVRALIDAVIDFFPERRQAALRDVIAMGDEVEPAMLEMVIKNTTRLRSIIESAVESVSTEAT